MLDGHLILARRLAIAAAAMARGMSIEELREAERRIDEIGWAMEAVLESVSLAMEGKGGRRWRWLAVGAGGIMRVEVTVSGLAAGVQIRRVVDAASTCAGLGMVLGDLIAEGHRLAGEGYMTALARVVREREVMTMSGAGEGLVLE